MTSPLRDALSLADYVPYRQITDGTNYMIYMLNTFSGNRRIRITQTLGGDIQDLTLPAEPIEDSNNPTILVDSVEKELLACLLSNPTAVEDPITCAGATNSTNCFALFGLHDVYVDNIRVLQNASPAQIVDHFDSMEDESTLRVEFCAQCEQVRTTPVMFTNFSGQWDWYINGVLYKTGDVSTWQVLPTDTYELYFSGDDVELPVELRNVFSIITSVNDLVIGQSTMLLVPRNNLATYSFHPMMQEGEFETLSFHSNGAIGWCYDPTADVPEGECESGSSIIGLYFPLEYDGLNSSTFGTLTLSRPDFGSVDFNYTSAISAPDFVAMINAQNLLRVITEVVYEGEFSYVRISNNHPTLNLSFLQDGVLPWSGNPTFNPSALFDGSTLTACLMPDFTYSLDGFKMRIESMQSAPDTRLRIVPKGGMSIIYGGENPTHDYIDGEMVACISGGVGECMPGNVTFFFTFVPDQT